MDGQARVPSDSYMHPGLTSLTGRRVLVTGSTASAANLRDALERAGATPIALPAIRVTSVSRVPELRRALRQSVRRLNEYDWVAFTSAAGVRYLCREVRRVHGDMEPLARVRVAAIGPATAAALREQDIQPSWIPPAYAAASIGRTIALVRGASVLLPRSNIAGTGLERTLRRRGATVDAVIAYLTVAPVAPVALAAPPNGHPVLPSDLDAVTFMSPSAVRGIMSMLRGDLRPLGGAAVICIGPTTAAAAKDAGIAVAAVARNHTSEGIVRALVRHFERQP